MAWLRRDDDIREGGDSATDPAASSGQPVGLAADLARLERERATGVVTVTTTAQGTAHDAGHVARIYLFQGRVYAAHLDGFEPLIAERMLSAGRITPAQRDELGRQPDGQAGAHAEAHGWISVDDLALLHQEYLLASLGAAMDAPDVIATFEAGPTTDRMCTLPLDWEPLQRTLSLRSSRTAETWTDLRVWASPRTVTFTATGAEIPEAMRIPELSSVVSALAEPRTLDDAAHALGLTRAEAVHIAGAAVRAGVLRVAKTLQLAEVFPDGIERFLVPEQFPLARSTAPAR